MAAPSRTASRPARSIPRPTNAQTPTRQGTPAQQSARRTGGAKTAIMPMRYTKTDMVNYFSAKWELPKTKVLMMINDMRDFQIHAIRAQRHFTLNGFGTWNVRHRGERKGHHPRTGAAIRIKARNTLAFRAAPSLTKTL